MKLTIAAIAVAIATTATAQPVDRIGQIHTVAEAALRDTFKDPDSAEFRWAPQAVDATDFQPSGWHKKPIQGTVQFACGQVNAKNAMGGYVGYRDFWVAEQDGVVVASHIDGPDDTIFSEHAAQSCSDMGTPIR